MVYGCKNKEAKMKNIDKTLFFTCIILGVFGCIMIYSSSYIWAEYKYGNGLKYFINQGVFLILGIFAMYTFSKINYKIYEKKANIILLVCFLLLVLVLLPGVGVVRNGRKVGLELEVLVYNQAKLVN